MSPHYWPPDRTRVQRAPSARLSTADFQSTNTRWAEARWPGYAN